MQPSTATGARRIGALVAICTGYFMVILDTTVVNVALPSVERGLGTGVTGAQWVVDAYTVALAALLIWAGALGDRLGARPVFVTGLLLFTAASAACGLAPAVAALVAARAVQGVGAALAVPSSLALLQATCPDPASRARAIGIWGGVAGVAAGAGPVVGGALVACLGWRSVFFVNLPIGIAGVIMVAIWVVGTPRRRRRADVAGQLAVVICLGSLTAGLIEGGHRGWTAPSVLVELAVGAGAGISLLPIEARAVEPLLPLPLLRSATFAVGNAVGLLINLGFYGELFMLTFYLQQLRHISALGAGLRMLPQMGLAVIGSTLSGLIMARTGPRPPMLIGLTVGAAGLLGLIVAGPATPYALLVLPMIATGLGMSLTMPAATAVVMGAAPDRLGGLASAVVNAARQLGGALGVALLGSLIASAMVAGLHAGLAAAGGAFALGALLSLRWVRPG